METDNPFHGDVPPPGPSGGTERMQPHDLAAEQAALGAMLLDPMQAVPSVTALIEAADYYRPAHETIHRAIVDLGEAADPITVAHHLDQSGDLVRCGGAPYLHTLVAQVPTSGNADWYAEIIREKARRRRLLEVAVRVTQLATSAEGDISELGAVLTSEVAALTVVRDVVDQEVTEENTATVANPLYDPRPDVRRPHRPGPTPHPEVFCGWAGDTVRELDPTTEADPVAVLVNLLSAAGAIIGRRPHVWVGNDRHPGLVWALTIGATAAGRKGSATSTARRVLAAAVPDFLGPDHTPHGLNSGEGLIEYVKDDDSEAASTASVDKRLWVVESEYAVTMSRGRREGSSLPGVLRQAWDGDSLGSMKRDAVHATDPHIAILGHITPEEFRAKMQDADLAGGTYNRFLPIFCHRNLLLPGARGASSQLIENLGGAWRTVLTDAADVDQVAFSDAAWSLYCEEIYPALTDDAAGGALAQFTARAAPYVQRVAMVYALCDHKRTIAESHMRAAWRLVEYSRASAVYLIGPQANGDPKVNKLAEAVRRAGADGLTGRELNRLFKNARKPERDQLVASLLEQPGFVQRRIPTAGRPTTVLVYVG